MGDGVGEVRQDRHEEDPALEPGLPGGGTVASRAAALGVPGSTARCRSGSNTATDIARSTGPVLGDAGEQRQVASQQRALRQQRDRRRRTSASASSIPGISR